MEMKQNLYTSLLHMEWGAKQDSADLNSLPIKAMCKPKEMPALLLMQLRNLATVFYQICQARIYT